MTYEEKIKGYFKNISNPVFFKFDSSVGTESQAWCELWKEENLLEQWRSNGLIQVNYFFKINKDNFRFY